MRVLAVDYGDQRTGIAVSDAMGFLVGRAWTVNEWNPERMADIIVEEAQSCGAERIVLGYPKNMDGTVGPRAEKCAEFKKLIESKCSIPVFLWDERRTTVDAHRILSENGRHGKKRKQTVDAVAASLILEGYLQTLS